MNSFGTYYSESTQGHSALSVAATQRHYGLLALLLEAGLHQHLTLALRALEQSHLPAQLVAVRRGASKLTLVLLTLCAATREKRHARAASRRRWRQWQRRQ